MHGGARPGEYHLIDFSSNLNPYGVEISLSPDYHRFPYCDGDSIIEEVYGVEGAVVAGITEAIYLVHLLRSGLVVAMKHTYGEYSRVARLFGRRVVEVPGMHPAVGDFPVPERGIVFLCNPNNPTGHLYSEDEVEELASEVRRKGAILVVDEAYADFVPMPHSSVEEGVLYLRSFTKSYGIPGIRVGYVYGDPSLVKRVKNLRMPWGIGAAGCAFLEFLREDRGAFLRRTLPRIREERERMAGRLKLKSEANFFLMDVGSAGDFVAFARRNGLLVRDCTSFGLPRHIRFSIRRRVENEVLLHVIEMWRSRV